MNTRKFLLSTVAVSMLLPALPAMAQVEEIVVQARKRAESILDVPVAISALTSSGIDKFPSGSLYTISQRVPGFLIGSNVANIGPGPSLRGVGNDATNPSLDTSVSLNIDGVGISQGLAYKSAMFDMEQVEVLKGPQALFFGKNSPGGVVSIRSKNPGDEFELIGRAAYEAVAKEKVGEIIISGPVTDTLGLRLAAQYSAQDGYFENKGYPDGSGLPGIPTSFAPRRDHYPYTKEYTLRGTAVWKPIEKFDATLKMTYTNYSDEGQLSGQLISCPDGTASVPAPGFLAGTFMALYGTANPLFINPNDSCKLDKVAYTTDVNPSHPLYTGIEGGGTPFTDREQIYGSLQMNYNITDNVTLSSVTGHYYNYSDNLINGGGTGAAGPLIMADTEYSRRDDTQEIRITSDWDFPLNFMVGGFYQNGYQSNRTGLYFLGPRDKGKLEISTTSWSAFGQLRWQVFEGTKFGDLEFAGGARWTGEDRELSPWNIAKQQYFDGTNGQPNVPVTELGSDNLSPEFTATYRPKDNLSFFLRYAEGFKSGSWDTVSNPRGQDISFGDEGVKGWEAGLKSRFFNDTLAFNMSGFRYKYSDLQVGANESTSAGFLIRTINAASATSYGVDLDATYDPPQIEGLQLFAAVSYLHFRFDEFKAQCWGGQTFADGCNLDNTTPATPLTGLYTNQDLAGSSPTRAPDWSANFGFQYERPIANGGLIFGIGSTTQYSDKYLYNILARSDFWQDSYFKTNMNLSLKDADDTWRLEFIGNNLNDKVTCGFGANANIAAANAPGTLLTGSPTGVRGTAGVDEVLCVGERGRELWVRLTLRPMDLINKMRK